MNLKFFGDVSIGDARLTVQVRQCTAGYCSGLSEQPVFGKFWFQANRGLDSVRGAQASLRRRVWY